MQNPKEKAYVEELIRVVRETSNNQVFDEVNHDKISDTYGTDGIRIIMLRLKEQGN